MGAELVDATDERGPLLRSVYTFHPIQTTTIRLTTVTPIRNPRPILLRLPCLDMARGFTA